MTKSHLSRLVVFVAIVFCAPVFAVGATLQARVVDVLSGNTLVVSNISRALRIKLKGIAPPEAGQPFSDTARDHLRTLVFDKAVSVEYTHLADGYLEAKIFLNGLDVASQMIRDGVAWYDHAGDYQLSQSDRDLYLRCEQLARSEKRGLWQDATPVAPWEFRRTQAEASSFINETRTQLSTKRTTSDGGFSNADLLGSFAGSSRTGAPTLKLIDVNGSPDRWMKYECAAEHFSILIPSNGIEDFYSGPDTSGHPMAAHIVAAGNAQEFYALVRAKTLSEDKTDLAASDAVIRSLVNGLNQGVQQSGLSDEISLKPLRQLRLGQYFEKNYGLNSGQFSGSVRVLTKLTGDQREFFVLFVLTRRGGESLAQQFLTSFKLSTP
jgi:endonuclease YncB( thermonuclease family)